MLKEARGALDRGCRIVIYPEGTRRLPLAPPDYRRGIVEKYTNHDPVVVPVALDSGLYWPRNSAILWPGIARAKFLPPIMPGLSAAEFKETLVSRIEDETNRMILETIEKGVSRPIPDEIRAKLQALKAVTPTTD
jgi:1-acyl-sn-glycerol-3-phosphate acyltransferase